MNKEHERKERLKLTRSSDGRVMQNFGHGRSKSVMVEVKKKRTINSSEKNPRGLSESEKQERLRALQRAGDAHAQVKRNLEKVQAASIQRTLERKKAERSAEKLKKSYTSSPPPDTSSLIVKPISKPIVDSRKKQETRRREDHKELPSTHDVRERRQQRLTITRALEEDDETLIERQRSLAAIKRSREKEKERLRLKLQRGEKVSRTVEIGDAIAVAELAGRMAERVNDVIKSLMKLGVMATPGQVIDADTAQLLIEEFGHTVHRVSDEEVLHNLLHVEDDNQVWDLQTRPPVVTLMGHVDHGKTSLLDALCSTNVSSGETGGITQHIGAYQIQLPNNQTITFLDTPGHEAFSLMRMRGAKTADIIILVVAADDGVQQQTIEVINHAKAADVPIILAINKCDKHDADPMKVRTQLLNHDLVVESLGGDVMEVEVSALLKDGLNQLKEAILLQAEILELKSSFERMGVGVILEAKLEKGRGYVASVLIQNGIVKIGDIFVSGDQWGRIRAMYDWNHKSIKKATPGMPIEIIGFQGLPQAGNDFKVFNDESKVRQISEFRTRAALEKERALTSRGTLAQMFDKIKVSEAKTLPIVIKADAGGSLDAMKTLLQDIGNDEVRVRLLQSAVGAITESDVTLAGSAKGVVVGFNVRATPKARVLALSYGVNIQYYSTIYQLADDVKSWLSGLLTPTLQEDFLGYAEVREIFNISKVGKIAGCYVTEGIVKRSSKARVLRDGIVMHEGALKTLKRFKEEVREVAANYECGIALESFHDFRIGDMIEFFEIKELKRELS